MANGITLDPELGRELAKAIAVFFDGDFMDTIKSTYDDCMLLGENKTTDQLSEKFMAFQQVYNNDFYPRLTELQEVCKEFTDYADYLEQMKMDTGVASVGAQLSGADNLGAAKTQLSDLTAVIS